MARGRPAAATAHRCGVVWIVAWERRRRRQEKSNGGSAGLRRGEVSGGGGVGREDEREREGQQPAAPRPCPDASAPWPTSTSTASIRPQPEDLEPRSAASIGTRTQDLCIGGGVPPDVEGVAYRGNRGRSRPPPWCRPQRALHLQLREEFLCVLHLLLPTNPNSSTLHRT